VAEYRATMYFEFIDDRDEVTRVYGCDRITGEPDDPRIQQWLAEGKIMEGYDGEA
jgi:hypothetical protein